MSAQNFTRALARVLVYEGGKVDDPHDPGGRTAYGVTQATFSAWLRSRGQKSRDVWTITRAEIEAIYRKQYWDAVRGDELPAGVDLAVFDAAVNSGVSQAGKWLQRALGSHYTGQVDGAIGVRTIDALGRVPDYATLCLAICSARLGTLKTLKTWPRYGKGWSARVANVAKISGEWAKGGVGPVPVVVTGAKASLADLRRPLISLNASNVLAGVGTAGATLSAVAAAIEPLRESLGASVPWLVSACAVLAAVGLTLSQVSSRLAAVVSAAQSGGLTETVDLSADRGLVGRNISDNDPLSNLPTV